MTLVNFTKKHRRRNGGIRLLGLIDQREVVSATYSELDADTAAAIEAIIEASRSGLIAVVVTINGDALLLGYSQEFGKERPLRIASAQATTGRLLSETTSETVTLRSEDVSKARPLLDDLNNLFSKI